MGLSESLGTPRSKETTRDTEPWWGQFGRNAALFSSTMRAKTLFLGAFGHTVSANIPTNLRTIDLTMSAIPPLEKEVVDVFAGLLEFGMP